MLSILAAVMLVSIPSGHGLTRGGSGGSGGSGRVSTADSIAQNTKMLKCLTFVMAKDYQDFVDDNCTKILGATHLDKTFWSAACLSTGCTACAEMKKCTGCEDGYILERSECTACVSTGCTCEDGYVLEKFINPERSECRACSSHFEISDGCIACELDEYKDTQCTACKDGYLLESAESSGWMNDDCTDEDECAAGTHDCDANAVCTNSEGSFTCECGPGFVGTGKTCNKGSDQ